MTSFAATVAARVKIPFQAPNEGPQRLGADDDEQVADRVEENRIAAARHAETEIAGKVAEAAAELGEVVDVVVEQVEEADAR